MFTLADNFRATILLAVSYPTNYPDVAPNLDISFPQNASARPEHLTLPDDKPHLLSTLEEPISESLGLAMVFTLITTLKESTESLIAVRISDVQAEKDREAAKEEEKENAKFYGEKVTKERFLAWRNAFQEELRRKREDEERRREEEAPGKGGKGVKGKEEKKLSGKELWEKGLVGKGDDEGDAADEKDALVGMENLEVRE